MLQKETKKKNISLTDYLKNKIGRLNFNSVSRAVVHQEKDVAKTSFISGIAASETLVNEVDFELLNEIRMKIELKKLKGNSLTSEELIILERVNYAFQNSIDKLEKEDDSLNEAFKRTQIMKMLITKNHVNG